MVRAHPGPLENPPSLLGIFCSPLYCNYSARFNFPVHRNTEKNRKHRFFLKNPYNRLLSLCSVYAFPGLGRYLIFFKCSDRPGQAGKVPNRYLFY